MPSVSPYRRKALTPSRPSATGRTAGSVTPSRVTRSMARYLAAAGNQSDSDSTLRNSSSSNSSGSSTEDTVGDATDSVALVSGLPQEFHKAYEALAPILGYSDARFMGLEIATLEVILNEVGALLRGVISVGYSRQWAEFNKLLALQQRISDIINVKKTAPSRKIESIDLRGIPGLEFARQTNWVAVRPEDWSDSSTGVADPSYLTGLYLNAMPQSIFSWEDVGAGSSEEKEIGDHPGPIRTLDYCSY